MNLSQKQSILNSINAILTFDFDQLIVDNSPSGNIDEIRFGEYSAVEFKNTFIKTFKQLQSELEHGLGLMLPNQETFNNEFGAVTLDVELTTFISYIQSFVYKDHAAELLKRFVYYQIRQGFWNKSTAKPHSIDVEKLNQAQERLILTEKVLGDNLELFNDLKVNLNQYLDNLKKIFDAKAIESEELTSILVDARTNLGKIDSLLTSATLNDAEILGFLTTTKSKLQTVDENIETYAEKFKSIETANKALADFLNKDLEEAKTNLQAAKEAYNFIESQRGEVTRLIGMAADGSLGYKFNSRKEDLERGIKNFWRWAVPGCIILALCWVVIVFRLIGAHLGNEWINLTVNLIKTSPAWLLVGFVFTQYGKERSLQEEYAFKSAIAMTLTSYSQMLSADDSDITKTKSSKQEMLLKSIENLYTQPVLKHDKSENGELLNTKQFAESLKSISEMVKNIKS